MKQTVATAWALLLLLFLLPLLLAKGGGPAAEETPLPTGSLPLDRTVITPSPASSDSRISVRVDLGDGEILTLPLDKYLWRVVAAEMPASFEPEALKAQAAAARTYTVSKMGRTVEGHPDADVCTDITCCQAYIDPQAASDNWGEQAELYTQKIASAVADTDGMIILYDGQPIQAVFHSSSAGRTVDAVEVWGNAVPYLISVDSPEGEEVPNWHSSVSFTPEDFKTRFLSEYPEADLSGDPADWFAAPAFNSSGGVETITIGGVTVGGGTLRTLLSLRSAHFTVTPGAEEIVFSVTGYGHGVGMSQYGANALAREGKTWEEIIKWYYTGVAIAPLETSAPGPTE